MKTGDVALRDYNVSFENFLDYSISTLIKLKSFILPCIKLWLHMYCMYSMFMYSYVHTALQHMLWAQPIINTVG
jgi:hypothetical protein